MMMFVSVKESLWLSVAAANISIQENTTCSRRTQSFCFFYICFFLFFVLFKVTEWIESDSTAAVLTHSHLWPLQECRQACQGLCRLVWARPTSHKCQQDKGGAAIFLQEDEPDYSHKHPGIEYWDAHRYVGVHHINKLDWSDKQGCPVHKKRPMLSLFADIFWHCGGICSLLCSGLLESLTHREGQTKRISELVKTANKFWLFVKRRS